MSTDRREPAPGRHELRVLFVCGGDFSGASEKQAVWFAEELLRHGHAAMISVVGDAATASVEGVDRIAGLELHGHRFRGRRLRASDLAAARRFRPTLVHSFSPRMSMVTASAAYADATGAPVFVHWEDDEWSIRDDPMRRSIYRRLGRSARRVVAKLRPAQGSFATPASLRWSASHAAGFDALTPQLAERVRQRLGRDCAVVLPITPRSPKDVAVPEPTALPTSLDGKQVLLYTGSVHPASEIDLEIALRATAEVQRRGWPVTFVHAGSILRRYRPERFVADAGVRTGTAVFLGYLPYARIPPLLRSATILLQPGRPTEFNRLRLPSKLQAYLASGTPTITFATGFGELLADRREVLKTRTGDPSELADRIVELLVDRELRATLGREGPRAAERLFNPMRNTEALIAHYRASLGLGSPEALHAQPPRPGVSETPSDPTARHEPE